MHATHAPPFVWRVWRIGRVNAFRPKGHGFDFRSSHHVGTLITSGVVIKNKFLARFSQYHPACKFSTFSVEVIDQCIRKMKRGKAPGLDRIEAEHLVHAHPRLWVLLSLLFNQMLMHGKVPTKFGLGVIIPVEKGAALVNSKSDNYRGITLSSNLSKLFEMCMLELYGTYLLTSDLQFGFKRDWAALMHCLLLDR